MSVQNEVYQMKGILSECDDEQKAHVAEAKHAIENALAAFPPVAGYLAACLVVGELTLKYEKQT